MSASADQRIRAAEEAAARLPPLLVEADRVATAVAGGVHGRRRPGQGDSFWEYRPLRHGEAAGRIDWRRSARDGRLFVRETEWEAAQTVCLWRDPSPRMAWRSDAAHPTKAERAALLLLALAALLLRGGERPRLLGPTGLGPPHAGPAALALLGAALDGTPGGDGARRRDGDGAPRRDGNGAPRRDFDDTPPAFDAIPPYGTAVLFGDLLDTLPDLTARLAQLAARPARGVLVQILDPAEALLPFRGRVRFRGLAGEGEMLAPRAETLRNAYQARLATHQASLRRLATEAGFHLVIHDTATPPEHALLAIHQALDT